MQFVNQRKISGKGSYFQVSIGEHPKFGKSLSLGIIPRKTVANKFVPDYESKKNILASFNQSARIANRLFVFAYDCLHDKIGLTKETYSICTVGDTQISFDLDLDKKELRMSFTNGSSVGIILDPDMAMIASDLIKSRMFELESEDSSVPIESNRPATPEELDAINEEIADKLRDKLLSSGFVTVEGLDKEVAKRMELNPNLKRLDALQEIHKTFGGLFSLK